MPVLFQHLVRPSRPEADNADVLIRERGYSLNGYLEVAKGCAPSDAGGCSPPLRARCHPSLCSHFAISLQSMAARFLAAQRAYAACLQPSRGLSSRRAVSLLRAAALRGFRRHITSDQAFIISSAAPAPRSYRLLTTSPVSTVSPVSERLKKKMKIKKKKKNPHKDTCAGFITHRWSLSPNPLPYPILLR